MQTVERIELKAILMERKIKQAELARQLNMTRQCLCDILAGRLKGWKYRRRISQYLGVEEEILFPDDGNKNQQSCQT